MAKEIKVGDTIHVDVRGIGVPEEDYYDDGRVRKVYAGSVDAKVKEISRSSSGKVVGYLVQSGLRSRWIPPDRVIPRI